MIDGLSSAVPWVEQVWGRPIEDVRRLHGGWTSTVLEVTAADGERAVLRLMTREPWRTHAAGLLTREAQVQAQLAGTGIPAPTSLALDADGSRAGAPAHLMSWLPGSLELTRSDDEILTCLARLLVDVHAVDPGDARPRTYQSWAVPAKRVVPAWAECPAVWLDAFEILEQRPPDHRGTFLHRDFHLGNILWTGDGVSGVVDWVETSWGPAGLDVAHASTYLAMLHGNDAAERFASLYQELAPTSVSLPDQRHWNVMDVVGYLPDPAKVVQPWRDLGHEISDGLGRRRLEQYLTWVLAR